MITIKNAVKTWLAQWVDLYILNYFHDSFNLIPFAAWTLNISPGVHYCEEQ